MLNVPAPDLPRYQELLYRIREVTLKDLSYYSDLAEMFELPFPFLDAYYLEERLHISNLFEYRMHMA